MDERTYWLGFSVFPGIGPILFQALLERFETAEAAWNASEKDLTVVLKNKLTGKFLSFREQFSPEAYAKELVAKKVWFVTLEEDGYPELLKKITNPPFVLFGKGNEKILLPHPSRRTSGDPLPQEERENGIIAIVGTRKITSYGREVTEMITRDLVQAGCVVVSGLALGVDAVAHSTTIANGGKTIAVLGCGVDQCYPTTNLPIYNSIIENGGAIVSEYPPGQPPSVGSFPSRNRIIAGLSEAVVVTEGAEDSGALITAEEAIKNGRKVFAVPGQITSQLAKGPLKLLQQGAKMVTDGKDILDELGVKWDKGARRDKGKIVGETKAEQVIIDLLQDEPLLFDELVRMAKVSAPTLTVTLSLLEVKGVIRKEEGRFVLAEV